MDQHTPERSCSLEVTLDTGGGQWPPVRGPGLWPLRAASAPAAGLLWPRACHRCCPGDRGRGVGCRTPEFLFLGSSPALPNSYLNRRALQPRGHSGDLGRTVRQVDTCWPSLVGASRHDQNSELSPLCFSVAVPHQPFISGDKDGVRLLHCLNPSNTSCPQPLSMARWAAQSGPGFLPTVSSSLSSPLTLFADNTAQHFPHWLSVCLTGPRA